MTLRLLIGFLVLTLGTACKDRASSEVNRDPQAQRLAQASLEQPSEPTTIEVDGTFDGYGDRPTMKYRTTVPVKRPTLRYGLLTSTAVRGGNWQPEVGEGFSIAIGVDDLQDTAGKSLAVGENYRCSFVEVSEDIYEATFVRLGP